MTIITNFKILRKKLSFLCLFASLTTLYSLLQADLINNVQDNDRYYDPAKPISHVPSKIDGSQEDEDTTDKSEIKDLSGAENTTDNEYGIKIEKVADSISLAYITQSDAKLLIENSGKVSADWVFISSTSYPDVKQYINTKHLAVCSSEEELEGVINNTSNLINAISQLDKSHQIFALKLAMQGLFLDDTPRKEYESKLVGAISNDISGESYIESLKSLFTLSGIINASKYTFSKVRDLAAYTAKSAITSPLLLPGVWLYQLIHGQGYEALFLAAIYELLGEKPDATAIFTLALGPAMFGVNMLTSIPDFILNRLGPLFYLSPFAQVVASILAYPISISASQLLVKLALSGLSYIPPFAWLGRATGNLLDKLYGNKTTEYVTKSESARRGGDMFNKLTEDAKVAETVSLPNFIEQSIESSVLDIARNSESLEKLSECVEQTIEENPDLITITEETFRHDDVVNSKGTVDVILLKQKATEKFISYITNMLAIFKKENCSLLNDMDAASEKDVLKSYLEDEIAASKELFEEYKNESPEKRENDIERCKKSMAILSQIADSPDLLQAIYTEYVKILPQEASADNTEDAHRVNKDWSGKVKSIYASKGIQIDDSEADSYSDFLLSLKLPITSIEVFYSQIIFMFIRFYNQVYFGFSNGVLASMNESAIDSISDFYISRFTNPGPDDTNALSRVLRRLILGNNISYECDGMIKFQDEIISIEDFINDYLIPNKEALLSEFDKEDGKVLSSVLYLFDKKYNGEVTQKIRKMFCLLCDAHSSKPSQTFIRSISSRLASLLNYYHISEAAVAGIITLLSASEIRNPYGAAFAPGIYWALRSSGVSKSNAFLQTIRLFVINEEVGKIMNILGMKILGHQSLASSMILSHIVSPLLSTKVIVWLESITNKIMQFGNEISKQSFIEMLSI